MCVLYEPSRIIKSSRANHWNVGDCVMTRSTDEKTHYTPDTKIGNISRENHFFEKNFQMDHFHSDKHRREATKVFIILFVL